MLQGDFTRNNGATTSESQKKELEQYLVLEQNPLKSMIQDMERDLELNHDFFLGDNVVCKSKDIIIPIKTIKNCSSGKKNYSSTKVKSQNFRRNIS